MPIIEERNLNLKQNKISLWWERWFLSSNAKDIVTLCFILGLFSSLLGTAFFVLIRLELSGLSVQYIADNQLYNSIMTAHAILTFFLLVMPLLPEYIYNSPPKPHAFCRAPLLSMDPVMSTMVYSAAVCSTMTPLGVSVAVFFVAVGIKFGLETMNELNYTQLAAAIQTVLDSLIAGHNINEILGWSISPELLQQLMVTDVSLIRSQACMYQVMQLALSADIISHLSTTEEIVALAGRYLSDAEPIVSYSQEHGIRLGHLRAIGRCMTELPGIDVSSLLNSLNTYRR